MQQPRNNSRRQKQGGYSLLMVIFMVATMILLTSAAALSIKTQGQREKETELVWRGEQYQRAIGGYYRKFGKYPTKIDDLVKQTNGVRFLRQAYTDPMNKEDGSWRFIYVGPNGQLIGSLRRISLLQSVVATPTIPGAAASGATAGGSTQNGQPLTSQGFNAMDSQPHPLEGAVIGGNIIGVASKSKESSLRVYQGGDTYEMWEFIWNPQSQVAIPGQGPNPLAPTGGQNGAPGMSLSPDQSNPGGTGTPNPLGGGPPPQGPPLGP